MDPTKTSNGQGKAASLNPMMGGGGLIPATDTMTITCDNLNGTTNLELSRPLPFWYVAHIMCKLIATLGDQEAARAKLAFEEAQRGGGR